MGEAKRKREKLTPTERLAEAATHKLADEGFLIRAGFMGHLMLIHPDGPETVQPEMRKELEFAFMGGALHLWRSLMIFLDPGVEPTEKDMARMDLIEEELARYEKMLKERDAVSRKTAGSA